MAREGHINVFKWCTSQNPPCPWDELTCSYAAEKGRLEALKFLRAQDPPCPWSRSACRGIASESDHQHVVDWIDQREDESDDEEFDYSDVESSDSD